MLNIFKKRKNSFDHKSLNTEYITEKNMQKLSKTQRIEYNNIIYHPGSSKEWFSSVFSYNKSYIKSLISNDAVLNKLLKSYFNKVITNKIKKLFKRRNFNDMRYSPIQLYISRAELKHTNTKLFITLYVYDKYKSSSELFIEELITFIGYEKNIFYGKNALKNENKLVRFQKDKLFLFRKLDMAFFKPINTLVRYLLENLRKKYVNLYKIPSYNIISLKESLIFKKTLFDAIKYHNINRSKLNNLYLNLRNLGLISLIEKFYKKKVEIEVVELKSIHLNSDVFSSAVALKLRDRKNKAVTILRNAILEMVRIPDLHSLITFDKNIKTMNKNNIINTIKQQVVSGVRFEASGRLTRRLTAMRAVFKYKYVGSLTNIRSSFNREPSTMLRGHLKANSQYTLINSKTRNGTFGLKGWVSSH